MKDNQKIGWIISVCAYVVIIGAFAISGGNPIHTAAPWRWAVYVPSIVIGAAIVWAQSRGILGAKQGKFSLGWAILICAILWIVGHAFLIAHN